MCDVECCWVYGVTHLLSSLSPVTYRLQSWRKNTDLCIGNGLGTNQPKHNHTNHLGTQNSVAGKCVSWDPKFLFHTHTSGINYGSFIASLCLGKKKKIFVKAAEFRLSLVFLLHTFSHGFSLSWAQGAFAKRGRGGAALIPPLPTHRGRIDISVYLRGRNKQRTACFPARYSNPGFATAFCPCVCNFVKLIIHIVGKIFRWKFFSLLTLDNGIRK